MKRQLYSLFAIVAIGIFTILGISDFACSENRMECGRAYSEDSRLSAISIPDSNSYAIPSSVNYTVTETVRNKRRIYSQPYSAFVCSFPLGQSASALACIFYSSFLCNQDRLCVFRSTKSLGRNSSSGESSGERFSLLI